MPHQPKNIQDLLGDPKFRAKPDAEKRTILQQINPTFDTLAPEEQSLILSQPTPKAQDDAAFTLRNPLPALGKSIIKQGAEGRDALRRAIGGVPENPVIKGETDKISTIFKALANPPQFIQDVQSSFPEKISRDPQDITTAQPVQGPAQISALPEQQIQAEETRDTNQALALIPGGGIKKKFAQSINLDRITATDEAKQLMINAQKTKVTETFAETKRKAEQLGLDAEEMVKRKVLPRDAMAAHVTAARQVNVQAAEDLKRIIDELPKDETLRTPEMLARFAYAVKQYEAIFRAMNGETSNIARALNAHKINITEGHQISKSMQAIIEATGGLKLTNAMLTRMQKLDMKDILAVNRFIRDLGNATTADKIFELWINFLLSSPVTHIVNTTSNTLVFLSGQIEKVIAPAIDFMRVGLSGGKRERFFGELPYRIFGVWSGLKHGIRKASTAFADEMPVGGISKIEVGKRGLRQAIPGKLGERVRLPGRSLMFMDEIFKALNYETEIRGLAFRQAQREGLKGKARAKRIAEILESPSNKMVEKAEDEMFYRVFQADLGKGGKALLALRHAVPGLRYILPFLRTPVNIAKQGLERTPLNIPRLMWKRLMNGEMKGGEMSDELSKVVFGSLLGAATMQMALEGTITGHGPHDPTERKEWLRLDNKPYSIRVGNEWYSYNRLEPLGMVMGLHADAVAIFKHVGEGEYGKIVPDLVKAIGDNILSKTFMQGLSNAFQATHDPDRYGERFINRFIGSFTPSIVAGSARAIDPVLRDPQSPLDAIKTRLPGLSQDVLAKRDVWGGRIKRGTEGIEQFLSPISRSKIDPDPLSVEFARLELRPGQPSRTIMFRNLNDKDAPGVPVKLPPESYDEYLRFSGNRVHRMLTQLLNSPGYKALPNHDRKGGKKFAMQSLYSMHRTFALNQFRNTFRKKINLGEFNIDLSPKPEASSLAGNQNQIRQRLLQ